MADDGRNPVSDQGMSAEQFYQEFMAEHGWSEQSSKPWPLNWFLILAEAYAAARLREVEGERDEAIQRSAHMEAAAERFQGISHQWQAEFHKAEAERDRLKAAAEFALEAFKMGACTHGEETWYCDGCRYEWENRIAASAEQLRAALAAPSPKENTRDSNK